MTNPRELLDEWQRLADGATPGPWGEYQPNPIYGTYEVAEATRGYLGDAVARCGDVEAASNASFIAAARTIVPALVAAVREVLELHRPCPVYAHADECGCGNEDHNILESRDGDPLCWDSPTGDQFCDECTPEECGTELVAHPCQTVTAITDALGGGS